MLCDFFAFNSFVATWFLLMALGSLSIMVSSGITFYYYYMKPDFNKWRWKTNPKFPPPSSIRMEIFKTMKGVLIVTLCPSLSLFLAQHGYSQAYCGISDEYNLTYNVVQFFILWILTDFYEFYYHYIGHKYDATWENHKSHHQFYNPSPFAVIADDFIDQFFRSLPLLLFPMLVPINIEIMFLQWASVFYFYGTYLHWGYESQYISAHNRILNTSYDHYLHHAKSIKNKPIRTGFFFKIWDNVFGAIYKGECFCVRCQQQAGKRTESEWKELVLPDYSVLLRPSYWLDTKWME